MNDGVPRYPVGKKDPEKEYITIRIRPRTLERIMYITIIIALLSVIAFQSGQFRQDHQDTSTGYTGLAVSEADNKTDIVKETSKSEPDLETDEGQEVVIAGTSVTGSASENSEGSADDTESSDTKSAETSSTSSEENKNTKESKEPTRKISKDDVELEINDVETVKKSDYWGKVTRVSLTLINKGPAFRPLFEVYAYTESMPQNPDYTFRYDLPIKTGTKEITKTLSPEIGGISLSDLDIEKTIIIVMKDKESGEILKSASKKFSFE